MGNNLGGTSATAGTAVEPTGTIVLGNRSVFCIGDMHGDAHALAKTLAMTGCVAIPEGVHAATRKCPHGNDVDLDAVRWREGCNDVVMFLGDLLDNRRSASADLFRPCLRDAPDAVRHDGRPCSPERGGAGPRGRRGAGPRQPRRGERDRPPRDGPRSRWPTSSATRTHRPPSRTMGKASTASAAARPASPRRTGPRCCRGWRP